jgi:hypothetical protein
MLVLAVPEYLDELLQDCSLASIASLCELRRVVVMTVYLTFMLVVAILRTEDSWAHRTGEMLDVVFPI